MHGRLFQLGGVLIVAGVLIGCKTTNTAQDPKHPDPLCCSKKPIEGKPHDADTEATVRVDPQPPPIPNTQGGAIVRQRVPLGTPSPLPVGVE